MLFIANWKMEKSYLESMHFMQTYADDLHMLSQTTKHQIVICPSFPALADMAKMCKKPDISIGAQTVSRHTSGAYTGQVSAQSLQEIGCTFCIIGHSETRKYQHETNVDIEHKCKEILKHDITPIICIGESKDAYNNGTTLDVLQEQLELILQTINEYNHEIKQYVIAYEPIWSIGTGTIPDQHYLARIFAWLHTQCVTHTKVPFRLLYGGSVNEQHTHRLCAIQHVDGLLIGGASLTFESFKAIIEQC